MTRLALVMIVRDGARSVGRALVSARKYVDRMIVLDTGSTDATRETAADLGAEVHTFDWCDDFAAARNAALAHSDAAWNLILDADEWVERGAIALGPAILPAAGGDFIGVVRLENKVDRPEEGAPGSWLPRVLPKGARYEGRIHEQPVGFERRVRLGLVLGHDGYTAENLTAKGDRNERLLMAAIEADPSDAYLWFQLGKEHQVRERPPQAALCFTEALRLAPASAPFRHPLVVRALTALKTAGRLEDAMALADAEVANWQESPDFYFAVGDLYLAAANADPDRALVEYLPIVESAWKRCLEIGERPDLDGAVAGRGSHMAAHNLAVFHDTLGRKADAARYQAMATRLRRTSASASRDGRPAPPSPRAR